MAEIFAKSGNFEYSGCSRSELSSSKVVGSFYFWMAPTSSSTPPSSMMAFRLAAVLLVVAFSSAATDTDSRLKQLGQKFDAAVMNKVRSATPCRSHSRHLPL